MANMDDDGETGGGETGGGDGEVNITKINVAEVCVIIDGEEVPLEDWLAGLVAESGCCPAVHTGDPPTDPPAEGSGNPLIVLNAAGDAIETIYYYVGGAWVPLKTCCPDPLVTATAAPAASPDDIQAQANTLAAGKESGTNIKIVDEWGCDWGYQVDASGVACRTDCPKQYNDCVDVRLPNITDVEFTGPNETVDRTFDVTLTLANLGCFTGTVDIDVTGHTFWGRWNQGDSGNIGSGDIVILNGSVLTSAVFGDVNWGFTNELSVANPVTFQAATIGAERHITLDPGAVATLEWWSRSKSYSYYVNIDRITIEGGSASLEVNA